MMGPCLEAQNLVRSLAEGIAHRFGIGSFSPSVYDTAWLAMVKNPASQTHELLFPQCFQYLLDTQQDDGSWQAHLDHCDKISNTMAALLAIKMKLQAFEARHSVAILLEERCSRATIALSAMLNQLNIKSLERVGIEVIVPSMLRLLDELGTRLDFRSRAHLESLGQHKLSNVTSVLHGSAQTTLVHSLEAFAGTLDYDTVKHHRSSYGAMMASPSSTAAYLMYSSDWDVEAEDYLRKVVEIGVSQGRRGGVPSAFPTTVFEITWIICTLLESGYTRAELNDDNLAPLGNELLRILDEQDGLAGFASECPPDADDTAMTISALALLGKDVGVKRMLSEFEDSTHFRTYAEERNPSLTVNCNVCLCLLRRDDGFDHTAQIVKSARFLSQHWYAGNMKDKWNISIHYLMMLIAKTFTKFLSQWEAGKLDDSKIPHTLVHEQIPVILLDILIKTLESQTLDGSWDNKHEVTAYAILTLTPILRLPWIQNNKTDIASAINNGKLYLNNHRQNWSNGDYLWIEKVAYCSSSLSLTYCLAAVKIEIEETLLQPDEKLRQKLHWPSNKKIQAMKNFFAKLPAFENLASWRLELWLLQAYWFVLSITDARLDIFPRKNIDEDRYLQYIPFTWISSGNARGDRSLNLDIQWNMMLISMLIYQADEFMEAVVGQDHLHSIEWVKKLIGQCCSPTAEEGDSFQELNNKNDHSDGTNNDDIPTPKANGFNKPSDVRNTRDMETALHKFIIHVRQHPKVVNSPAWLQAWLVKELEAFLLAHITQIEDCQLFMRGVPPSEQPSIFKQSRTSYYDWVRTAASNSTSCPFAFVFFLCLIDEPNKEVLADGLPRYLAQSACRHLANMCRQHNDYGSVVRDRVEKNLNSVNFADFHGSTTSHHPDELEERETMLKEKLLQVAEYERCCRDNALAELDKLVDPGLMKNLRTFVNVTDLYGQIYLVKDISPYKISSG